MWNVKGNDTNELRRQKKTHRLPKAAYGCQGVGMITDFGKVMHTAIFKMDSQQRLTVYHMNPAQCHVPAWMGGALGENGHMYVCG